MAPDRTLNSIRIGFALTGSFCTFDTALLCLEDLVKAKADVTGIISNAADETDTRFMTAAALKNSIASITGKPVIRAVKDAEPIGPGKLLDLLLVLPATGNTLAKIANGITDTPVTMAVKAHLRNNLPVVLAVSTNDALGNNAKNIGLLLNMKNIFFVPLGQDDPANKPKSMVFMKDKVIAAIEAALEGRQVQPLLCAYFLQST